MRVNTILTGPLAFTLLLSSCNADKTPNEFPEIKKVIILIGDDHTTTALGSYGNDIIRTPNLDRLASNSVRFMNAYSNAPVCSASRQSVLTGKYPHATGVTLLRTYFEDEGNLTLAEILKEHNFKTAVIGKTHFNNHRDPVPPNHGFEVMVGHSDRNKYLRENPPPPVPDSIETLGTWKPFRDPARIWLNADVLPTRVWSEYGHAAWDAKNAIEFMQQNYEENFLLWVGFHEPHSPFNFPIEYAGKYDPADMPLPEGSPEDDRWVPEIFRDLTDEDKRGIIASYYTSTEYMDENIGKILDEVERLGIDDETLIVYFGDQGYLLGEHKRFEKHTMWEEAIKAPLIFYMAGEIYTSNELESLVQFVDITPTILDILNIEIPGEIQGKSLKPLLTGKKEEVNDYVFAEFLVDNKAMVTDGKWKYIFTTGRRDLGQGYATGLGPSGILHKLYNLEDDPEEKTNVAANPENQKTLKRLQEKMIEIFTETHPEADLIPPDLSYEDQLIWYCEPRDEVAD
jgi:arylsulfatase A-like enzyme